MTLITDKTFSKVQYVTIDENRHDQRIDNFLLFMLKSVPKSHVYRILRKGEVRVNKKRIKANYRLQQGDVLRVPPIRVAERQNHVLQVDEKIKRLIRQLCKGILYQDDNLIIINKPDGLAVHSGTNVPFGLIEVLKSDFTLKDVPEASTFYDAREHLELVHRLDQGTSGCLMIAKNRKSLLNLQAIVKARDIEKHYICLLKGNIAKDHFTVNAALLADVEISGEKMVVVDNEQGKSSISEFTVLQRFNDSTLVKVNLITGRKHQIRVHTRHIGHAIIGDQKYGDKNVNAIYKEKGLKRLFLHAQSLLVPTTEKKICVQAELPDNLAVVLKKLT